MIIALYLLQLFCGCMGFFFFLVILFNDTSDTVELITLGVLLAVHFFLSLVEAANTKSRPPTAGAPFLVPFMLWTLLVMTSEPWDQVLVLVYVDLGFVGAGVLGVVLAYLLRDST